MEIKKNTYCGRCGNKGMKRETRKRIGEDKIDVIYQCLNPKCSRAEAICVSDGKNRTKRLKDNLGNIMSVSKEFIDKFWYKE